MVEKEERPSAKRGPWKRRLKITVGLLFGATLAWLMAPTVFGAPEPPPLFTEADLPAAPAAADNGWSEPALHARAGIDIPSELQALLRPGGEGPSRVERARTLRATIAETLDREPVRERVAAFERAIDKPRFADACPVPLQEPCLVFPLLRAHQAALLDALRKADGASFPDAVTLLAKTLRADLDFATTSRTFIANMIGLTNLRDASEVAADVFEAYRAERARDPSIPALDPRAVAALSLLDGELARLDPKALDARRGIVAEYLLARKATDYVADPNSWQLRAEATQEGEGQGPTMKDRLFGFLAPLLLDKGATQATINARHTALRDAVATSAPLPTFPAERDKPLWWLYNVTGEVLLDSMRVDLSGPLRTAAESRARIEALRPVLRKLAQDLSHS